MIQYNDIHWYRVLLKTLVNGHKFDTSIEPTKISRYNMIQPTKVAIDIIHDLYISQFYMQTLSL